MTSPHPLVVQARAALQAGRADQAAAAAQARLREAPADLDALEIAFLLARQSGRAAEAEAVLRTVLRHAPRLDWAHDDLVQLLSEAGRHEEALAAAEAAILANPVNPQAQLALGAMLSEAGGLAPGETHLRRALEIAGPHPQILANLALNLLTQGRLDEAETLFVQLEKAGPLDVGMLAQWAKLREVRGDLAGAHRLLDRAEKAGGDVRLSRAVVLTREGKAEEALALIEAAGPTVSPDAQLERGRLRDRLGRHAEAWRDFTQAKARLSTATGRRYDAQAVAAQFARLKQVFAALPGAAPIAAPDDGLPRPVFILGFPRSGTTLIEQVLSSHSQVQAGGELPFVAELGDLAAGADLGQAAVRLRAHYLARAAEFGLRAPGAVWFTDKMPLNDVWLPLLRLAFPDSPVIRLRRHPLDVAVSMLSHHLTHGFDCGYRIEDIAAHMLAMHDLSGFYETELGLTPTTLRYEDFVAGQEAETERLLAALGLEMEPACLSFHQSRRYAPTPSYAQVTEPLNDRSIGRWKAYRDELSPVLPALAGLLADEGYNAD